MAIFLQVTLLLPRSPRCIRKLIWDNRGQRQKGEEEGVREDGERKIGGEKGGKDEGEATEQKLFLQILSTDF